MIKKLLLLVISLSLFTIAKGEENMKSELPDHLTNIGIHKNFEDYPHNYGLSINIKNVHCAVYINDLSIYNSAYDYKNPPRNLALGQSVARALTNGINELRVRIINRNPNPELEQTCRVSFNYMREHLKVETLSQIEIVVDDAGKFSAENSVILPFHDELIDLPIYTQELSDTIDPFNPEVKDILFTRKIIAYGLPATAWSRATPYIDSPENRQKLIAAYEAQRELYHTKDFEELYYSMAIPLLEEVRLFKGDMMDAFVNDLFIQKLHAHENCKAKEVNYDDYRLETYNGGRLVRLVNDHSYTPLGITCLEGEEGKEQTYGARTYFSLIDGEFVLSF